MGSLNGARPMVAWDLSAKRKKPSTVYYTERGFQQSASMMRFAKTVGLCSDVKELSEMASSVGNSDGVFFIPDFVSIVGFVGCKNSTTKQHLVRAVLEAIVFTSQRSSSSRKRRPLITSIDFESMVESRRTTSFANTSLILSMCRSRDRSLVS